MVVMCIVSRDDLTTDIQTQLGYRRAGRKRQWIWYDVNPFQKFHAPPLLFHLPGTRSEETVKGCETKESTRNYVIIYMEMFVLGLKFMGHVLGTM